MMKGRKRTVVSVLLCIVGLAAVNMARAADSDSSNYLMPEDFYISLGYLWLQETDTSFSVSSSDGVLGTTIDYQRDLGGDDASNAGRLRFYYRFTQKHRFDFSTYAVRRDGDRVLGIAIEFDGEEFDESTRVKSEMNTTFYKGAYSYSFYHSKKAEIAFLVGLHVMDYSIKLESEEAGKREAADVTAPLPVWGLRTSYGITRTLFFNFWFENFYINLDDKLRGSLIDTAVGFEWRPFKHFGAGVQLVRTALDAEVDSDDFVGDVGDLYRGAELYIATFF